MSYTSVFGGNTIYPSDVSYLALALDADVELEWPLESSGNLPPAARIIDVTPDTDDYSIVLPDATLTGAGQVILFNNVSGSYSFYVKDNEGNTLATIAYGEQWELYLAATTTAGGTWRVFCFGASTATVQPSALAGYGLTVTGSTLSQSLPVTTFNTTGYSIDGTDRASAFVWTSNGSGTLNLLAAATAGNNFFVFVRNGGGGDLTIEPSGSETINDALTLVLRPGDSATLITDGLEWYTVGLGQQAVFAFDYTSILVTGGTYTLAGSELNRITYKFVGTLTSDLYVIVPSTIQQYWINNATTGSFSLYVQTSDGTPVEVNQGAKGIYYCDGTDIILASNATNLSIPVVVAEGGTGATTQSGARAGIGISTFADAIVTALNAASVRTTIVAAKSGANTDITSLGGLTTPLSIAQGGTNATTQSGARTSLGATTVGSAVFTAGTQGDARTAIDAQQTLISGTNIKTINGSSVLGSGDLSVAPFPSGTKMLFAQTAAPTGWTKQTTSDNAALRVVSGSAGTGGTVDFTTAFSSTSVSGTTGSTALTEAQIPSHRHFVAVNQIDGDAISASNSIVYRRTAGGDSDYLLDGSTTEPTLARTSATGSGDGHTHGFSTTVNLAVKYVDVIIASKD